MSYNFKFEDKNFTLSQENCEGIFFEDNEIKGISLENILSTLNDSDSVDFSKEYYTGKCECNKQECINKSYCYLEYHFYIYTKNSEYIINTLCKEYENTSFNKLFSKGEIDDSYIVEVTVCPCCATYSIDISQCEV